MLRHYDEFRFTGDSFEARVGPPDPISAAVGRIALNFAVLQADLGAILNHLVEGDEGWGRLLMHPLSFDATLEFLEDRVRLLAPTRVFNTGDIDPLELFAELRSQCVHAAQLRAQVPDPTRAEAMLTHVHRWKPRRSRGRDPQATSARKGDRQARQPGPGMSRADMIVDPGELLDVADFICMVTEDVRAFFMLDWSTRPSGESEREGLG
jgi:hypothetical protein